METETVRYNLPIHQQCLKALERKGPALPIELAVRTFSFPDEIQPVVKGLQEAGLVEIQRVWGRIPFDLISLTDKGARRIEAVR